MVNDCPAISTELVRGKEAVFAAIKKLTYPLPTILLVPPVIQVPGDGTDQVQIGRDVVTLTGNTPPLAGTVMLCVERLKAQSAGFFTEIKLLL